MQYAVVQSGGKQYKVSVGDIIEVDKLQVVKDGQVEFDQTLLFVSDGKVKIGKPVVSGVKVIAKSLGNIRGEKLRVSKYKAKVRHRRTIGFRADYTKVKIEEITEKKTARKTSKKA